MIFTNAMIASVLLLLVLATVLPAQEPVDAKVKAAIYEIDRAEKQITGATAGQASRLKRISRIIESAEQQLQASENKSHESWIAARARLDALINRMEELNKPAPANPAAANQLSAADLNLLGTIDRQTDGFVRQLSEYDAADYSRLRENLFQRVSDLKRQYQGLANPTHPQAIAVAQKVLAVEKQINDQLASVAAQESSLGDVESEVGKIRERLNPSNRSWFGSPVPNPPFTAEMVTTFAQEMNTWKADAQRDLKYLQNIEGKTTPVNVRDLTGQVNRELTSIDQYNTEMANRIEAQLAGADQVPTYMEKIPEYRADAEVAKLQYGLELLKMASEFDKTVGRPTKSIAERERRYNEAIVTIKANARAARAAADAKKSQKTEKAVATSSSPSSAKKMTPQRIEIFGSTLIEVTAAGEVWINGDKAGDITADGEIWVAGDKEGDITAEGEVWKAGNKIGDITADGEVWRDGNQIGNVESDGTIWVNSSREGWFKGGSRLHAAVIVFYGFFNL